MPRRRFLGLGGGLVAGCLGLLAGMPAWAAGTHGPGGDCTPFPSNSLRPSNSLIPSCGSGGLFVDRFD